MKRNERGVFIQSQLTRLLRINNFYIIKCAIRFHLTNSFLFFVRVCMPVFLFISPFFFPCFGRRYLSTMSFALGGTRKSIVQVPVCVCLMEAFAPPFERPKNTYNQRLVRKGGCVDFLIAFDVFLFSTGAEKFRNERIN